jgi:hypothetical protein
MWSTQHRAWRLPLPSTVAARLPWWFASSLQSRPRASECLLPHQQPVCCFLTFFAFPSFLQAVKAISTIGFVFTLVSVFFVAVVYLWICYCNCFFVGLQIGLLDLLRFVALLAPLGCSICGAPYQTALTDDHFSWSLYQEYIRLHHLFDVFFFNFCLSTLMRLIRGSLLSCPTLYFICCNFLLMYLYKKINKKF